MPWIKIVGAGYWTLFVATFLTIAVWETFQPKRPLSYPAQTRWGRHALLFAVSGLAQSAVFRISPVLIAAAAANNRFGILNHAWLPYGVRWAAAVILLDLLHYATHRVFHAVPYLWRIHEIHHSDPDYDVSTAVRFHPIEVVSEQGIYVVSRPPMQVRPALPRRGPPSSTRRLPGPRGAEGALSRTGPPRAPQILQSQQSAPRRMLAESGPRPLDRRGSKARLCISGTQRSQTAQRIRRRTGRPMPPAAPASLRARRLFEPGCRCQARQKPPPLPNRGGGLV